MTKVVWGLAQNDDKNKRVDKILESLNLDKLVIETNDILKFTTFVNRVKILRNITKKPEKATTEDFRLFFQHKFEKIRDMITEKVPERFISLSSIMRNQKGVWVVGMVREIKSSEKINVEFDDPTGSITLVLDSLDNIENDDVFAVYGDVENGGLRVKRIVWPDVPLRAAKTGFGKICVVSDLHLNEAPINQFEKFLMWFNNEDIKYLFIIGNVGDLERLNDLIEKHISRMKTIFLVPGELDGKEYPTLPLETNNDKVISLSNPSIVEINGVVILLIHKFDVNMLKKRYLGKPTYIIKNNPLVLDIVPDLVLCGYTKEPEIKNYKSITIVNAGSLLTEFKPTVIDLSTREYRQMTFN